jgi:hypothetical protein
MPRFVIRPIVCTSLLLFGAIAAQAQTVTEVKAADQIVIHGLGEVRLLGVEGLGQPPVGTREGNCAETTRTMVYGLIHAKQVRLVTDAKAQQRPGLAMHRYLYLPDGRMLNSVVLETGCARLAAGAEDLQFGAMLKSIAANAQMYNRGIYAPTDASGASAPARPYTAPAPRPSGLTLASFNRISLGMSFADVNSILGSGKELSRFESTSFTATSFQWETSDGSGNVMISFHDGKVNSKHQYGLK